MTTVGVREGGGGVGSGGKPGSGTPGIYMYPDTVHGT